MFTNGALIQERLVLEAAMQANPGIGFAVDGKEGNQLYDINDICDKEMLKPLSQTIR